MFWKGDQVDMDKGGIEGPLKTFIEEVARTLGPENVLTDYEDLYVYSYEKLFLGGKRKFHIPKAVIKIQSSEEFRNILELAEKYGVKVISRDKRSFSEVGPREVGNSDFETIIDWSHPPSLPSPEEFSERLNSTMRKAAPMQKRMIAVGCAFFPERLIYRCKECDTCTGYCTVAPYFKGIETWSAKGRFLLLRGFIGKELVASEKLAKIIYSCTACGLCFAQCIKGLKIHKSIMAARQKLVELGFGLPRHMELAERIEEIGNPYGEPQAKRATWLKGPPPRKGGKILYWAGCTTSLRTPEIAEASFNILRRSGIGFTYMGPDEGCCGSLMLRTGFLDKFKRVAERNVSVFKDMGIKTLVTSCAGCYATFKGDYREVIKGFDIEVLHISELISDFLNDGRVRFQNPIRLKITYHDPCHLGRHSGVFEEPRDVLTRVPDISFAEMKHNRDMALCCGGGGGVTSAFRDLAQSIARGRMEEAMEIGCSALISTCPFCKVNFVNTAREYGLGISVMDLTELAYRAMVPH
jgi:heterodisulfide reductase subunit D